MKKLYALLITFSLAILALVPLGGNLVARAETNAETNIVEVSTEAGLQAIATEVNNGTDYAGKTITLTSDITLSNLWTPIGTQTSPFRGSFNGNGHTISNLSIGSFTYQGLFGYAEDGQFTNLQISGGVKFNLKELASVFGGALMGYGKNVRISLCEVDAPTALAKLEVTKKSTIGSLVGGLEASEISNSASYLPLSLSYKLDNVYSLKVGGIVGSMTDSKLEKIASFGSVGLESQETPKVASLIIAGGIAGEVLGNITSIKDSVYGGSVTYVNNGVDNVQIGEIIGQVSSAIAPQSGNLSSIAFLGSGSSFGSQGGYVFKNPLTFDNVMKVTRDVLLAQDFYTDPRYSFTMDNVSYIFEWNIDTSVWDFENAWVMTKNQLHLQQFQFFKVFAAQLLEPSGKILETTYDGKDDNGEDKEFAYGEKITMPLSFQTAGDERYYEISEIILGSTSLNLSSFTVDDTGAKVSPNGEWKLSFNEEQKIYNFEVSVSSLTEGTYSFRLEPIKYMAYFLAGENGGVRYKGSSTTSPALSRELSKASGIVQVEGVGDKKFTFASWSLFNKSDDGELVYAGKNWKEITKMFDDTNPLTVQFATGDFTGDFLVRANFNEDPCALNFSFDTTQIEKIEINGSTITESGKGVLLDKRENVNIKVFVKKEFVLDQSFADSIKRLFINENANLRKESYKEAATELTVYEFSFSTASIDYSDTSTFSFSLKTSQNENDDNDKTTLWIILGSVGGGLLLIGIGVTIFLVLRRRGPKPPKDDYKRYYY